MSAFSDLGVLWHMLRGMPDKGTTAERLEAFYAPQAQAYDDFRERLLQGRRELINQLQLPSGAVVIELGAGTGRNLHYLGDRLSGIKTLELVDLCPALLEEARKRASAYSNVRVVEADATVYRPAEPVDCVIFSYSMTMIPDWKAAMDNAFAMLKPGGTFAVVDFTLGSRLSGLGRWFWKRWFGHDGVHLNAEHPRLLKMLCPEHYFDERQAAIPYLPGLRVPYYLFLGKKPHNPDYLPDA